MSKLLDKLKKDAARLKGNREERKKRGEFTKTSLFKPVEGDNIIRIMPHWSDPEGELFYKEVRIHFSLPIKGDDGNIYKIPARCLRDFEEDCPLCDAFQELIKEDKVKAKEFRVTERAIYNVMNYKSRTFELYVAEIEVFSKALVEIFSEYE